MLRPIVRCPQCGASFEVKPHFELEERLMCPGCDEPLKIVQQTPLQLEWAWEDLIEGPDHTVSSIDRRWRRL